MPQVFIPQAGRSLDVNAGQTILLAALAAGIPYPHGCKSDAAARASRAWSAAR